MLVGAPWKPPTTAGGWLGCPPVETAGVKLDAMSGWDTGWLGVEYGYAAAETAGPGKAAGSDSGWADEWLDILCLSNSCFNSYNLKLILYVLFNLQV